LDGAVPASLGDRRWSGNLTHRPEGTNPSTCHPLDGRSSIG